MLNTHDIDGASPQKFRLKNKRHEYLRSPYHSSPERTTFTDTFKKMVIPHDVYHVPDIASKITNIPAPPGEVDPFGVSIRKDKFRDSNNESRQLKQSSTLESTSSVLNDRERSSLSPIRLMQVPPSQQEENRKTFQNQGLQAIKIDQDEQRKSRNNFNADNASGAGYKERRSQSHLIQDSLDQLKTEVDKKIMDESPTQLKKALHNFYGLTPPSSKQGNYYKSIDLKRQGSDHEPKLSESYYQSLTRESAQQAQQDSKYNKALKNFFGATNNEPKKPQLNLNHSYAGFQPSQLTQPTSPQDLLAEQKKIDYSFGGYGHSQYFQPKLNLNSRPEVPFTLDPLTHQKIYKTGAKHQNNYSVQLETKPENDYFYVRSNSPAGKLYGLH